jgi:hypothetical protein
MTLAIFYRKLKRYARPAHDWICLGDGSICIRDHINADPMRLLCVEVDPTYAFRIDSDEVGDEEKRILRLTEEDWTDLSNAIAGDTVRDPDPIRNAILAALKMPLDR